MDINFDDSFLGIIMTMVDEAIGELDACIDLDDEFFKNPVDIESKYYKLSKCLYDTVSKLDEANSAELVAKLAAKEAYNKAYAEAAENTEGKKKTVAELTAYAEQASGEEQLQADSCTKSYKLLKGKFDEAHNVLKLLEIMMRKNVELNTAKSRVLCE